MRKLYNSIYTFFTQNDNFATLLSLDFENNKYKKIESNKTHVITSIFFNETEYNTKLFANNVFINFLWNTEDVVVYITNIYIFALKLNITYLSNYFGYNISSFFSSFYWYERILSGAPKLIYTNVFEYSTVYDFINYAKTIKLPIYFTMDVCPASGLIFPYLMEHLEIAVYLHRFENNYFINYFSSCVFAYLNNKTYYFVDTTVIFFVNASVLFLIWFYIKVFFLSFFINFYNDSSVNDTDYTLSVLITEVEKEIADVDDLIIIFLVLFFIFGLYFLFYGFAQLFSYFNNYVCVCLILPFLFFFVYVAPVCLLFDFGLYVFVYLRGSGPTSMLAAELLYDIINTFAYFIRVFIQLARILLMLIAAGSLQEFIYYFGLDYKLLICNDSFLDTIYNLEFNFKNLSLFFFTKLPLFILYWIYEIFHTYFVVTIQTIAFFAMVFWLFFYLFTFFFSESHENYLKKKRIFYKKVFEGFKMKG